MMMFRRGTHNKDKTVKSFSEQSKKIFSMHGLAAHTLEPDRAMSFDEYVALWRRYESENPSDPSDTSAFILESLYMMVREGFVTTEEIPDADPSR